MTPATPRGQAALLQRRRLHGFTLLELLVVMVINTRVKISIHALIAALAVVVFPAGVLHPAVVAAAVLVWALASWSRVRLSRHSVTEVLIGSFLGAVV
ncbi:MAG: type II secretion system protein, partial [Cupriavidus sp.]|nr:type II secretion system protein [Cupriavidus sp.]